MILLRDSGDGGRRPVFRAVHFTNRSANDVGFYRLIVNNSPGSATISVMVFSRFSAGEEPLPGSFASQVIQAALGARLPASQRTGDPLHRNRRPAGDRLRCRRRHGGVYETNADNGGGTALISLLPSNPRLLPASPVPDGCGLHALSAPCKVGGKTLTWSRATPNLPGP